MSIQVCSSKAAPPTRGSKRARQIAKDALWAYSESDSLEEWSDSDSSSDPTMSSLEEICDLEEQVRLEEYAIAVTVHEAGLAVVYAPAYDIECDAIVLAAHAHAKCRHVATYDQYAAAYAQYATIYGQYPAERTTTFGQYPAERAVAIERALFIAAAEHEYALASQYEADEADEADEYALAAKYEDDFADDCALADEFADEYLTRHDLAACDFYMKFDAQHAKQKTRLRMRN